jgi:RimJ/RimL family protein N-acetyltransferase
MEKLTIVTYDESFLPISLVWLNDPEIGRLTGTPTFSREDQTAWFRRLAGRGDYKVWGMEVEGRKIGALGLKGITGEYGEYFGYIGERTFWNRRLSGQMLDFILGYARTSGLDSIWLQVIRENERAIRAYRRYGFSIWKEDDLKIFMNLKIIDP